MILTKRGRRSYIDRLPRGVTYSPSYKPAKRFIGYVSVSITSTVDMTDSDKIRAVEVDCSRDYNDGVEKDGYFPHSDHLGSASWITDNQGDAVQHLQYLPYGEPYINQRLSGYNERFTFTGKERDEETGYNYHGARYYDASLLTGWLSVDPLADKYPSMSPYNYCAWNPVKLVDPDGEDVWDVNKQGELIWKEKSETDVIMASDGTRIELSNGLLKRGKSYTKQDGHFELILDKNNGGDEGNKLFEFMADHSNVEFCLIGVDQEIDENTHNTCSILTSSYNSNSDDYGSQRTRELGCSVISHTHNHPSGYNVPSSRFSNPEFEGSTDRDFANKIRCNNANCKFFIYGEYNQGGIYREYMIKNEGDVRIHSQYNKNNLYTRR